MGTSRRDFLRWVGLSVTGAAWARPSPARADRIRILPGEGPSAFGPHPPNVDFQRFVAGVHVGSASVHGALAVFWLEGGAPSSPLTVTTLNEARSRGDLLITERDQATVPQLLVDNRGKSHVLLLAGEILLGGKQHRVLSEDILLPPRSGPRNLGVYCVEAGRWSGRVKHFESKGTFAAPRLRSRVMERADQGRIWAEVDRYAREAGARSPTQSYQEIYDQAEVKAHVEEVVQDIDRHAAPSALGAAVFVGDALTGLDLFFEPDLFSRQWPKLLRAHALEVYRRPAQPDRDIPRLRARVEDLLHTTAHATGRTWRNAGVGRLFEFRADGFHGSALTFEARIVHAAIL